MAPTWTHQVSEVATSDTTLPTPHPDEQKEETKLDEHCAEDEEEDEDESYCYDNETVEVSANGSNGAIAQLEQCSEVQLGARLHYHAPVVINQHFGSEHHEAHIPAKTEKSGKDIYDLFAPNKDEKCSCNKRLWIFIIGLFLANVAVIFIVVNVILANNPEDAKALEQKARFNQFLSLLPTMVKANKLDLVRWMLQQGADTEVRDEDGWTAAHRAAESGAVPMLQLLAEYGADMKTQNTFGDSAIHIAVAEGRVDAINWLLNNGSVPANILSKQGVTPLYNAIIYYFRTAVATAFPEILQMLKNKGADLSRLSYGGTALHLAASKGYVQAVKDLLIAGADVNKRDSSGKTPLHMAASEGNLEVFELLVKHGAIIETMDKQGKTPVDLAKDNIVQWFKAHQTSADTTDTSNKQS